MDKKLGPWPKGMNNIVEAHSIPDDTCINGVNLDFSNDGKAKRRDGSTKVYSGINTSNGYSCPGGCFLVENKNLKLFNNDNTTTTLFPIIGSTFAFFYKNNVVYFSDGIKSKKIIGNNVVNWGMSAPSGVTLYGVSGGYKSGTYTGAAVFIDQFGVESGSSELSSIYLPDNSGMVFTNLPTSSDPQVMALRLYLSMPNGSELYHIADVPLGTPDYMITGGVYDDSNTLEMINIIPPPPGSIIFYYKARMYVVHNNVVEYSEQFEPDHFIVDNTLQFNGDIILAAPTDSGIFFATNEKTWFYEGIPDDGFQITEVLSYGALSNAVYDTKRGIIIWQSQRGMVMGQKDGNVKNIQEENVAAESGTDGVVLIKDSNGIRQAISVINNPKVSTLAASSFIEAEIIRRS